MIQMGSKLALKSIFVPKFLLKIDLWKKSIFSWLNLSPFPESALSDELSEDEEMDTGLFEDENGDFFDELKEELSNEEDENMEDISEAPTKLAIMETSDEEDESSEDLELDDSDQENVEVKSVED